MSETPSITVKDLDPEDQPRERAEKYGVQVLSTTDLWALILRVGTPGTPITQLCRELMRTAGGSMRALEQTSREMLMQTKGIGLIKAVQIEAVLELIRRYNLEKIPPRKKITGADSIAEVMQPRIGNLDHEEIWVIFLSQSHEIIEVERFSVGSAVASVFDVKRIILRALELKAQALVLTHNHPSGNLQPSPQDDHITRKLQDAAKLMDLRMLDHVILAYTGHYSYFDNGRVIGR